MLLYIKIGCFRSKMQIQNIFYPILLMSCFQIRKKYTLVTMFQDETKLCDSTVLLHVNSKTPTIVLITKDTAPQLLTTS
jgi:hypothetical protein